MGIFFTYIIKSTVCLLFFYLFYRLLLSRETFHRFNRIALLGLILLSVIIPFVRISTEKVSAMQYPILNLEQLLLLAGESVENYPHSVVIQLVLLLYIVGVAFFLFRLLFSARTIWQIIKSGERIQEDRNQVIIVTDWTVSPFSCLKYIVLSRKDWEENKEEIIAHEKAHIRYRHSLDVFISGACIIFHWFNPAAWLLKQELQNIHEYEADESVINQGIDAKRYQLLLIKKAVGSQRFTSMANSFNHSKLKKRITMMLKSKSNSWARLKYLYVLPLAAIAITAFARPEISRELEKISSTKISELPLIKEALTEKIEPVVPVDTFITIKDVDVQTKIDLSDMKVDLSDVEIDLSDMDIKMELDKAFEVAKVQEEVVKAIQEAKVEEKVKAAMEEAKIEEQVAKVLQEEMVKENIERIMQDEVKKKLDEAEEKERRASLFKDAVFVIDGVKASQEEMDALDHKNIESISVLKDKAATEKYGEDAKGGVLLITTKKK